MLQRSEKALLSDFNERVIASSPTAEAAERDMVIENIHKRIDIATGKNINTKTNIPKTPKVFLIMPR